MMEKLFSPWRLRYITSARRKSPECLFCTVRRSKVDRASLILARGAENFVILNKYPYNNGHLMIVPNAHLSSISQASESTLLEMMRLAARCEAALRQAYRPSGINLGMNLGRSAGAGIEDHFHLHLVPRWDGDTNFMTVVHGTRVIPEALGATYRRLKPLVSPAAQALRRVPRRSRWSARARKRP